MNLPNLLTLSRIVFAVFIVLFLLSNSLIGNILAAVLFIIAAITDFYDGYWAKKMNLISDFGKIMDPIADKVLILSVFATLASLGLFQMWMVIVIAVREVAVTVSRLKAMTAGHVWAAEKAGKIKTVFQILTISVALTFLVFERSAYTVSWFYQIEMGWRFLAHLFMVISMFLTVFSGVAYFKCHWKQ